MKLSMLVLVSLALTFVSPIVNGQDAVSITDFTNWTAGVQDQFIKVADKFRSMNSTLQGVLNGGNGKAEIIIMNSSNVNLQVDGDSDRPVTIKDSTDVNGQVGTGSSASMHNGNEDAGLATMHNGDRNAISESGQQAFQPADQEVAANSTAVVTPQDSGVRRNVRGDVVTRNGIQGFEENPNGAVTGYAIMYPEGERFFV